MSIGGLRAQREPPYTEPYVRWCGSWEGATPPGYPVVVRRLLSPSAEPPDTHELVARPGSASALLGRHGAKALHCPHDPEFDR